MNQEFLKFERLKGELINISKLCPKQYFAIDKCSTQ